MKRKEDQPTTEGRELVPDDKLIALWGQIHYTSHIAGEVANRNLFTHIFRHSGFSVNGRKVSISFEYRQPGVIYRLLDTYGYKYTLKPGVVLNARQIAAFYQGVAGISIVEPTGNSSERRFDLAIRRDGDIVESAIAESTHRLSAEGVGMVTSLRQGNDYYRHLLDRAYEDREDSLSHAFITRSGVTPGEIEPAERYISAIAERLQAQRVGPQPFFPAATPSAQ